GATAYAALASAQSVAFADVAASDSPPIYLTDFDRCLPGSALSRKAKRNRWRLLDYEAEHLKGVLLVAGQNTAAPEITYPLNRKGWYAIYIGLRSAYGDTHLQVKLA